MAILGYEAVLLRKNALFVIMKNAAHFLWE